MLLTSTCAHFFARNWQLPFLNQRMGENDSRKYFMINLHTRMLLDLAGVKPTTSWSSVRHPSDWATEASHCLLIFKFSDKVIIHIVGTYSKRLTKALQSSTHNICFYGGIRKIIPELSSKSMAYHRISPRQRHRISPCTSKFQMRSSSPHS